MEFHVGTFVGCDVMMGVTCLVVVTCGVINSANRDWGYLQSLQPLQ